MSIRDAAYSVYRQLPTINYWSQHYYSFIRMQLVQHSTFPKPEVTPAL